MDEKEQRKADTQLILEGKEAVVQRIVEVFNELFHKDKNATSNLRWLASQLIHAEMTSGDAFKYTTLRHDTPLKAYIEKVIQEQVAKTMANAMALHTQQMDGQIKQIKKLEKKTWWKR